MTRPIHPERDACNGAARAQLQVHNLRPIVDASDDQAFLSPIEREGLAELEVQGSLGWTATDCPSPWRQARAKSMTAE